MSAKDRTVLFCTHACLDPSGTASKDPPIAEATRALLTDYFQLHVNLRDHYQRWSRADPNFKHKARGFPGVRVLRQDPVENLFSFICSSNNNIKRITLMVDNLCRTFGQPLGHIPSHHVLDTASESVTLEPFYTFPTLAELHQARDNRTLEPTLRALGFGYRARYIQNTVEALVAAHGAHQADSWLRSLRDEPYDVARAALLQLSGVGPKVADCICLMSLDKAEVIPVDTHVWQIALRDYTFDLTPASTVGPSPNASRVGSKLATAVPISVPDNGKRKMTVVKTSVTPPKNPKSLTPTLYRAVNRAFQDLFGEYAGWAHS
ncbi:8-oxoguanine glycosylase ogg1, partial [Tieghemiomyces parasiticus]